MEKYEQEILSKKYQNFYVNDENIVCGIVTPKEIWKIRDAEELKNLYVEKIDRLEKSLKQLGNYQPYKQELERIKKSLNKLNHAIDKMNNNKRTENEQKTTRKI